MRSPRGLVFAYYIPFASNRSNGGGNAYYTCCIYTERVSSKDRRVADGGPGDGGGIGSGEDYLISFSLFFMSTAAVGWTTASVWKGGRTEGTLF